MISTAPAHPSAHRGFGVGVWTVALSLVLVASLAADAHAQTFYVDNQSATCSNSGAGTEAEPYCTITAAVAADRGPGIAIIVKPGIYREQVTVPASGAAGNNFVIQASGPGVLVDGSDDFANAALWAPATGTVWVAASVTWNALQVFVDGARLTPSTLAPEFLPVNAFTWLSGQGLYVNLGGDNPGSHETLVGHRLHGFNIFSKSWVTIDGFEISRVESRGVNIQTGCTDLVVSRNRVSFTNSYGIQTVNGVNVLIAGNVVSDGNFHGIGLTAGANHCTVRDNECFRNIDPNIRRANGIHLFGAPNNTLYGNRLHDNQDTGMQFTTGSNDCISYNNRSWNNGDHGYDHLNVTGTIHFHDVAAGNFKDGFSIEGVSPNSELRNCIAVENGLTTGEFNLWVNLDSSVGLISDYNIFCNSTAQPPIKYIATQYASLADYQLASGQDAHSAQGDPRFVSGATGDFRLSPGSPAIDGADSGVPNWPATDAMGSPRVDDPATVDHGAGPVTYADIGALEFAGPGVLAPAFVAVNEGRQLVVNVTAYDPVAPIVSLTANLAGLPAGNNATFTPNAMNTAGTLAWTPTFVDSGTYVVSFTATSSLPATASTTIHVNNVDRAPVVSSPPVVQVAPGGTASFTVTALDPDGDPIQSLIVVPTKMPPNSGATFTVNATNTAGTFTWVTTGFSGNHKATFVAANALTGSSTTNIQIKRNGPNAQRAGAEEITAEAGETPVAVLALSNGFPNPSRGAVEFALDLPQDAHVKWAVFDLQGRIVWSEEHTLGAGRARLRWDGTASGRTPAAAGIYLVRAWVDGTPFTRRVVRF